jgi:hypothetical protein
MSDFNFTAPGLPNIDAMDGRGTGVTGKINWGPSTTLAPRSAKAGGLFGDVALSPEAMQKILGLFGNDEANEIAAMQAQASMLNAMRPIMGHTAPSPGHVSASQVKVEDAPRVAPVSVIPGLAQILGGRV